MKEIESIIIFPQYLRAKPMKIVIMKMVTAMPVSANAPLILSMPKIVQFPDVSSYSQSHYIEVPQEGVSSRAKQNWLWIFIFVRKQIQIYFLDFLVKTQISNCFVLFLTQNPKIHTNLLDSPCENTDANEFIWFYLT